MAASDLDREISSRTILEMSLHELNNDVSRLPAVVSDGGGLAEIRGVAARAPAGDSPAFAAAIRAHIGSGPRAPVEHPVEETVRLTLAACRRFLGDDASDAR